MPYDLRVDGGADDLGLRATALALRAIRSTPDGTLAVYVEAWHTTQTLDAFVTGGGHVDAFARHATSAELALKTAAPGARASAGGG